MVQSERNLKDLRHQAHLATLNWLAMIDRTFLHEIRQCGLDDMVRLTSSRIGFLYSVDSFANTIGLCNTSANDLKPRPLVHGPGVDLNQDGVWKASLVSQEAFIRNQPVGRMLPQIEDLGPVNRDLTVPVFSEGKIVAIIGIGSGTRDYDTVDVELLQEMANSLWRVVIRKRLHDSISDDVK